MAMALASGGGAKTSPMSRKRKISVGDGTNNRKEWKHTKVKLETLLSQLKMFAAILDKIDSPHLLQWNDTAWNNAVQWATYIEKVMFSLSPKQCEILKAEFREIFTSTFGRGGLKYTDLSKGIVPAERFENPVQSN